MQLITHSQTQDTGEGGPLSYKSIGNQSQLLVTAQKHTYMLAAGQSIKTGRTHTEGDTTIHTPLCMDNTYNLSGRDRTARRREDRRGEEGRICNTVWLVDCKKK